MSLSAATLNLVGLVMTRGISGGSRRRVISLVKGDTTKLDPSKMVYDDVGFGVVRGDLNKNGLIVQDVKAGIEAAKTAKDAANEALLTSYLKELTEAAADFTTNPPPWDDVMKAAKINVIRVR